VAGSRCLQSGPVALLASALLSAIVVAGCGGDSGSEVILEPAASTGSDTFTVSVATERVQLSGGELDTLSGSRDEVESVTGSTPELYGGTGEKAACDAAQLISFLERNPGKAAAFAAVIGISQGEIEEYVNGLTPLILREDTRVTNHGFEDGEATPFDAVLQAGTAVLVDSRGVPRVRCACGNPLAEPIAVSSSPEFSGDAWSGFDERRLIAISAAERSLQSFEVVDVETGETYEQSVGAGGQNLCAEFADDLVLDAAGQSCNAEGFSCALTAEEAARRGGGETCEDIYAELKESMSQESQ